MAGQWQTVVVNGVEIRVRPAATPRVWGKALPVRPLALPAYVRRYVPLATAVEV